MLVFDSQCIGVVHQQTGVVLAQGDGFLVGRQRILVAFHHAIGTRQHGPAVCVVRVLLHAFGQLLDHGHHLGLIAPPIGALFITLRRIGFVVIGIAADGNHQHQHE